MNPAAGAGPAASGGAAAPGAPQSTGDTGSESRVGMVPARRIPSRGHHRTWGRGDRGSRICRTRGTTALSADKFRLGREEGGLRRAGVSPSPSRSLGSHLQRRQDSSPATERRLRLLPLSPALPGHDRLRASTSGGANPPRHPYPAPFRGSPILSASHRGARASRPGGITLVTTILTLPAFN